MLENLSMRQYEPKGRDNLIDAENQQGRPVEREPSTTIRTTPVKQFQTRNQKGYSYNEKRKRWVRIITDKEAFCTGCEEFKSLDSFANVKGKPHHYCKKCVRLRKAAYRYNLTVDEVKKLYSSTHCECCGEEFECQRHQHIHHINDEVIGVVCLRCNHTLRDESPRHLNRLKNCVNYIENRMKIESELHGDM